ncbi:MAG: tetratricopeptide repeat protein [Elusimicrobiota bacterium]|jgi:tetratricopeptide (TPR) repeat protein
MRRHIAAGALILCAVLGVWSNTLGNGFVWDDHLYILNNPLLREASNIRHLLDPAFYTSSPWVLAGHRPVFLASLFLDRSVWGFDPSGYHLTNLFLHASNSLWVYALAWLMTSCLPAALLAGLLFGLHPVTTEAVNGVCFRSDLLAAFFVFAGLWTHLKLRGRSRAPLAAAIVAALFGLGLLSKEMAASLPLLILLAEAYFPLPQGRPSRLAWAAGMLLAAAVLYAAFWAPRFQYAGITEPARASGPASSPAPAAKATAAPIPEPGQRSFFSRSSPESTLLNSKTSFRVWTMAVAFSEYVKLMVFPAPLVVDRSPGLFPALDLRVGVALAVLAVLLLYAVVLRSVHPLSAFGAAWFFASLLPVSGIVPLYNPVAERYLYLTAAGACWAMGSGLALLARAARPWALPAASALASVLLLGFGLATRARNDDWRNDRTLFLSSPLAVQTSRASFIRGNLLRQDGRLDMASREYIEALRSDPLFAEAWLNLGMAHADAGNAKAADACYRKAAALKPDNPVFLFGHALFLSARGDKAGAISRYREALAQDPSYVQAWVNLGALLRDQGRLKEAASCFEKALALAPFDPVAAYSYGLLLEKRGKARQAVKLYRRALASDPGYAPAKRRVEAAERRRPGRP